MDEAYIYKLKHRILLLQEENKALKPRVARLQKENDKLRAGSKKGSSKLKCPICEADTLVVNVRTFENKIRRNRRCPECDYSYHTYEIDAGTLMDILEESDAATLEKHFPMPREYRKVHEKWG